MNIRPEILTGTIGVTWGDITLDTGRGDRPLIWIEVKS